MKKSLEKQLLSWLNAQKEQAGLWIQGAAFCSVISTILLIIQAYLIAFLLHHAFIKQTTSVYSATFLSILVGLSIARGALTWLREYCGQRAGEQVRSYIRNQLLTQIQAQGPVWTRRIPAGQWGSLLFENIEKLHEFFAKYLPQRIIVIFTPCLILTVIFPLNWASGLIFLLTLPLLPIFMILVGKKAALANQRHFSALTRLSGYFLDRLRGLTTLQHFHQTQTQTKQLEQACEQLRLCTMSVLRLAFLSGAVLEFFAALCIAMAAVYFGFSYLGYLDFGHYDGKVSLLTGLFILILAPEFYMPLRELGTYYHAKAQAIGAAEQLAALMRPTPDTYPNQQTQDIPLQSISINAHDLIVETTNGKRLLGPLTFSVAPGDKIAIMGASGSGKSTLIQTLLGFYRYRGSLTINGVELAQLNPSHWAQAIGWLGQDMQLLYESIRENLTLGAKISDEHIIDALKQSQAWDFVCEKGLDYRIGDSNTGVSVGQAQRLALARLILKPHALLLLDEPTASLDTTTAEHIEKKLMTMQTCCTSFWVTHQPLQAKHCDQIWILNQGQLIRQGSFSQLKDDFQCAPEVLDHA